MSTTPATSNYLLLLEGQSPNQAQNHLNQLLGSLIQRNRFQVTKEVANQPRNVTGNGLGQLISSIQNAITHRITRMTQAPRIATAARTDWGEENIRLQHLYKFLRYRSGTEAVAFRLCEDIRNKADKAGHEIMNGSSTASIDAVVEQARQDIGKVVFAIDRSLAVKIDTTKFEESMASIRQAVTQEMKRVYQDLQNRDAAANAPFNIQDHDMLMYIEKPKEIAKMLLTSEGQINFGLIDEICHQFFSSIPPPLEYESGILYVMSQMTPGWQKAIDAVEVPNAANAASAALVRADLGLMPAESITRLHCQQGVLTGILSQLCQGSVGDCFAVSWAIKKHNEFLLESIADYTAIVRDGYLTRSVNGASDQFFFETTIADDGLDTQFTLNGDGTIDDYGKANFWDCPNLIAACRQMGISDLKSRKDAILAQIYASTVPQQKTWGQLIQACAEVFQDADHPTEMLNMLGRYGFSLSNNRLLRAWETSLAAMAEARRGDYVRDNVIDCVMQALDSHFTSADEKAHFHFYHKSLIEEVKKTFQKTLNDSFRLVYNGAIPLQHISNDGSSSSGGFELYRRDVKDLANKGIRVATPEQFRTFVLDALDQTTAAEMKNVTNPQDRKVIASVTDALKLCAHSPDFMRSILWAYDKSNQNVPDPVAKYQDLERTPMTSLDGDDPWQVIAIDDKNFTPDVRTIRPKDPGDLLKWLLGLAQWKESTQNYLNSTAPKEEDEATAPDHAFNIEFKNDEFKAFLGSKRAPGAWIQKTLIEPGLAISNKEMDNGAKLMMQHKITEWLGDQLRKEAPDSLVQNMNDLFSNLNANVMTVHHYAERLQDGLIKLFKSNKEQQAAWSLALDRMLIRSLPAADAKVIQDQAVRFAKTNWDSGPRNLYFCCFFNPRTQKVDFGSIAENHTSLEPMDQNEWIDQKQWEVDPDKI